MDPQRWSSHRPHPFGASRQLPYTPFPPVPFHQPPPSFYPYVQADAMTLYNYDGISQPVPAPNSYYHPSLPINEPGPSRPNKGRDYLLSLQTSLSNLDLFDPPSIERARVPPGSVGRDKPLPRLPAPPVLPDRPRPRTEVYAVGANGRCGLSHSGGRSSHRPSFPTDRPVTMPLASGSRSDPLPTPPRLQYPHDEVALPPSSRLESEPKPTVPHQWIGLCSAGLTPPVAAGSLSPSRRTASEGPNCNTPPKSFRPSFHPNSSPIHLVPPSPPSRPRSDPPVLKSRSSGRPIAGVIDLTYKDSDIDTDSSSSTALPKTITARSPARRRGRRATSEQSFAKSVLPSPSPAKRVANASPGQAERCAGFTRTGQPCKRLVRMEAAYLSSRDLNLLYAGEEDEESQRVMGRYCKDHAGMICQATGFYWRGGNNKAGIWIDFNDFIPIGIGKQTQTLLRMTMESVLTAKETPGFLYAYELRDIQSPSTSYFKVGRTDNVARRMGEWTTRCSSHTPTLRDIFPLSPIIPVAPLGLIRKPSGPTSLLPGAVRSSPSRPMCPAVKRWERLVHLELADRSVNLRATEFQAIRQKCEECKAVHREIFPLERGDGVYEGVVRECAERWEGFVRRICE